MAKTKKKSTKKKAAKKKSTAAARKTAKAKKTAKTAKSKKSAKPKKTATKKTAKPKKPAATAPKMSRPAPNAPALGSFVPNFEVASTGGKRVSLEGLKGKTVVLYFYPKDATPGCTIEGHEFTKLHEQFKNLNAEIYGVSRDSLTSHESFKTKECYSIDLLSDDSEELCRMFDVIKMKNMYGKEVRGIERSTFIIDPEGRLLKEWRGVKAEGHAQEVLNFLTQRP